MSSPWQSHQVINQVGYYGDPVPFSVTGDEPVEILPRLGESWQRHLTISVLGPDPVLLRIGGDASKEIFNVVLPPGFNDWNFPIGWQNISVVCEPGKTSKMMVAATVVEGL